MCCRQRFGVLAVAADRAVRRPDVALLVLLGRVVGPRDLRAVQQVALRQEVEARLHHLRDSLGVDDLHELFVGRVAPEREGPETGLATRVVVRAAGLRRDRVQVVRERRSLRAGEEVVEQRVVRGPLPVVGQLVLVELRVGPTIRRFALVEPVHRAVVPRRQRTLVAVRDVLVRRLVGAAGQRPPNPVVEAERDAARTRERAEQVVEGPVLLDQEHHVLDRPARRERVRIDDRGRRRCGHHRRRGGRSRRLRRRLAAGSALEHAVATIPATTSKPATEVMRMRPGLMSGRGYRGTS